MNIVSLGVRNAFRNLVRSTAIMLILGLSIGLSVVMLIAHQAVGDKINQVKGTIGNTITIAPAGFSSFSQVNNDLTSTQLAAIKTLPNVTDLTENLTDRLTTIGAAVSPFGNQSSTSTNLTSLTSPTKINLNSNSFGRRFFISGGGNLPTNFSPPISIIGTTNPAELNGSTLQIISGQPISGTANVDKAMISSSMASKNNLAVGSTFTAYSTTLTVSALFNSGTQSGNNYVIVSLPTEQTLSGQSGAVTSAIAAVNSLSNLSSTSTAIKNKLGSSADVTSSISQANQALQPLDSVQTISLYSLIGSIIAGSIIILMTMVMIVRERRREIGILKAIGASNGRVIFQFMVEALTFTLLGAVIGLLIGVVGGSPVTKMLVSGSSPTTISTGVNSIRGAGGGFAGLRRALGVNTLGTNIHNLHAVFGWSVLIYGLGGAILIALIGSAFAGWMIAKVKPSEVMRAE